jgi:hypothetical protein
MSTFQTNRFLNAGASVLLASAVAHAEMTPEVEAVQNKCADINYLMAR